MKLKEAILLCREINLTDNEDELTFKSCVLLWLGMHNGWDKMELQKETKYDISEIETVILNLTENNILIDNKIYGEFDDSEIGNVVEITLMYMCGAGIVRRHQDIHKEKIIEPEIPIKMPTKKTLNEHLFEALDRLSSATPENIQLEIDKAASIVSVSQEILSVAQMKLNIIAVNADSSNSFNELIESHNETHKLSTNKEIPYDNNPNEEFNTLDDDELVDYGGKLVSKKTLKSNSNKDKLHSHDTTF